MSGGEGIRGDILEVRGVIRESRGRGGKVRRCHSSGSLGTVWMALPPAWLLRMYREVPRCQRWSTGLGGAAWHTEFNRMCRKATALLSAADCVILFSVCLSCLLLYKSHNDKSYVSSLVAQLVERLIPQPSDQLTQSAVYLQTPSPAL